MSAECHDNFLVKLAEVSSFEKDENSGLLAFPTQVAVSRGTWEILFEYSFHFSVDMSQLLINQVAVQTELHFTQK